MDRRELARVPGVPETVLTDALLARLTSGSAPAPWRVECEAVVWVHRAGAGALQALPPLLASWRPLAVVGGMARYSSTPVGAYDEVFGAVVSRSGARLRGSVVFMAVDSEASVVGGRSAWGMPKTLASFRGAPVAGFAASGDDRTSWRVAAVPRGHGPALPVAGRATARQVLPGGAVGETALRGRGWMRPAIVTVEVESDGPLPTWLRPGRHLGAVGRLALTLPPPVAVGG